MSAIIVAPFTGNHFKVSFSIKLAAIYDSGGADT
jgi:hypothetical protein